MRSANWTVETLTHRLASERRGTATCASDYRFCRGDERDDRYCAKLRDDDTTAFYDCRIICVKESCESMTYWHSTVACHDEACHDAVVINSYVLCRGEGTSCAGVSFIASEGQCEGANSCQGAYFDMCSCCDGLGCPENVPSCLQQLNRVPHRNRECVVTADRQGIPKYGTTYPTSIFVHMVWLMTCAVLLVAWKGRRLKVLSGYVVGR
jgi:hypothetical protein